MPKCCEEGGSDDDASHSGSENGDSDEENSSNKEELQPVRSVTIVMLSMVLGYASTIGPLQHEYKVALGIGQHGETAHLFTEYAGFAHVGKLIGYVGHNLVLACLTPLQKVYVSMLFMFAGIMVPAIYVFLMGQGGVLSVLISYSLSGFGFGVFEVTFLNVITPLGKPTKSWAIMGFPLGFAAINIVCPLCSYFSVPVKFLFWCILGFIPLGVLVLGRLPLSNDAAVSKNHGHGTGEQKGLIEALYSCSSWLPAMLPQMLARFVVEFVMQNNPNYYIYNDMAGKVVPLWDPTSNGPGLVDLHLFFTVFGTAVFLGDAISRRISFMLPLETLKMNVLLLTGAVICSIVAFCLMAFDIAALAVVAIFLAFWGNGLMYGAGAKYIDHFVAGDFNLAAYSMWSFAGGVGSIFGAEMIDLTRGWYCGTKSYPHVCLG